MNSTDQQLLVNGDFASGDLHGWAVDDPANYNIVAYEQGKNCLVQLSAPAEQSIRQSVEAGPGMYFISVWHRATDAQGNPVDKRTVSAGTLSFPTSEGGQIIPLILFSNQQWNKWAFKFVIRRGEGNTPMSLSFQNIDNSTRQALHRSFGVQVEETPVALRDISLWRMNT